MTLEQVVTELIRQIPDLVVLAYIVSVFLKYSREKLVYIHDLIRGQEQLQRETGELLQLNARALDQLRDSVDSIKEAVEHLSDKLK